MLQIFLGMILLPCFVMAKLQVATTTTDLAAVVQQVGQEQVQVFSIAKGTQDPHEVDAKPSFMVKLRNVDLVIAQGLELESAWIQPLIQGSRNPKLANDGLLELGALLEPIEIPKAEVSRAEGDVHPGGNPHFQLDPIRLGKAAVLIGQRLGQLDPTQKDLFQKNADKFQKMMFEKTENWKIRIKKTGLREIVTYHKTFSYFCDRFDLICKVQLEPKPGIPPTAGHILSVIGQMKAKKMKIVLIENLYEDSVGSKLKQEISDVFVRRVPVSVEGEPGLSTNEMVIESLVHTLEEGSH